MEVNLDADALQQMVHSTAKEVMRQHHNQLGQLQEGCKRRGLTITNRQPSFDGATLQSIEEVTLGDVLLKKETDLAEALPKWGVV